MHPMAANLAEFLGTTTAGAPDPDKPAPDPELSVRDFCRQVLASPEYRASLYRRITLGELPAQVEAMLWNRAWGKEPSRMELTGKDGGPIPVTVVRSVVVRPKSLPLSPDVPFVDGDVVKGVH